MKKDKQEEYVDLIFTAEISSEPEIINYENNKKQVFEIENKKGQKITCISWETYDISKGDLITAKGRLNLKTKHMILFKRTRTNSGLIIIRKAKNEDR